MPALLAHWIFAERAINRDGCPESVLGHRDLALIGSQGTDPLFFYGRYPFRLRPPARIREAAAFAHRIHANDPSDWFGPLLLNLRKTRSRSYAALVYGFLLHYVLDRFGHPFVYAHSGFDAAGQLSPPFDYRHMRFETVLDYALLEHLAVPDCRRRADVALQADQVAVRTAADDLGTVFPHPLKQSLYYHAWRDMQSVILILHDPHRILFRMLKAIRLTESVPAGQLRPVSADELAEFGDILNLNHHTWPNPITGETCTLSFPELFDLAADQLPELNHLFTVAESGRYDESAWTSFFGGENHEGTNPGERMKFFLGRKEGI